MGSSLRYLGFTVWYCLLSFCTCCQQSWHSTGSFRDMVCADLIGGVAPCEVALAKSRVLVFSPFCPACRECIRQIGDRSNLVGLSAQSVPYLRYYQVKLPIRFRVFKVRTEDLRRVGVMQIPCLLTTDDDGGIIQADYDIEEILEASQAKAKVTSAREVGREGSGQEVPRIPARAD